MARGLCKKSLANLELLFSNNYKDLYDLGIQLGYKGIRRKIIKSIHQFILRNSKYIKEQNGVFLKTKDYLDLCNKRSFNPSIKYILKDLHYMTYKTSTDQLTQQEWDFLYFFGQKQNFMSEKQGCLMITDRELMVKIDFYKTGNIELAFLDKLIEYDYDAMLKKRNAQIREVLPRLKKKYNIALNQDLTGSFELKLKKGHVALIDTAFQEICEKNNIYINVYDKDGEKVWFFDHSGGSNHFENGKIAKHPQATKRMERVIEEISFEGQNFTKTNDRVDLSEKKIENLEKIDSILDKEFSLLKNNEVSLVEALKELQKTQQLMQEEEKKILAITTKLSEKVFRFDNLKNAIKTPEDYKTYESEVSKLADHEKDEIKKNIL
jgi:hypothetical protein